MKMEDFLCLLMWLSFPVTFSIQAMEMQIKKQFQDTCKVQTKQYKALESPVGDYSKRNEHKTILKTLKDEQTENLPFWQSSMNRV